MTDENAIVKIIYKDTWYDVMKMQTGGTIAYDLFPDGSIGLSRYDVMGNCLEKTRSKMAEKKDFDALTDRMEKRMKALTGQGKESDGKVTVQIIRADGSVFMTDCGCGTANAALGNSVWDYIQQFAMSSDAFI